MRYTGCGSSTGLRLRYCCRALVGGWRRWDCFHAMGRPFPGVAHFAFPAQRVMRSRDHWICVVCLLLTQSGASPLRSPGLAGAAICRAAPSHCRLPFKIGSPTSQHAVHPRSQEIQPIVAPDSERRRHGVAPVCRALPEKPRNCPFLLRIGRGNNSLSPHEQGRSPYASRAC